MAAVGLIVFFVAWLACLALVALNVLGIVLFLLAGGGD
jgi:hypothetical protein